MSRKQKKSKKDKPENIYDKISLLMTENEAVLYKVTEKFAYNKRTLEDLNTLAEAVSAIRECTKPLPANAKNRDLKESAQYLLNMIEGVINGFDQKSNFEYLREVMQKFQERWDALVDTVVPLISVQKDYDKKAKNVLQKISGLPFQEQIEIVWGKKEEVEQEFKIDVERIQKDINLEVTRKSIDLVERARKANVNWLAPNTKGVIRAGILIVVESNNWISNKILYQLRKNGYEVERMMQGTYVIIMNAKIVGVPVKKKKALNDNLVLSKRMQDVLDVRNELRLSSKTFRRVNSHFYGLTLPLGIDLNVYNWIPIIPDK